MLGRLLPREPCVKGLKLRGRKDRVEVTIGGASINMMARRRIRL
jgi:hypothetical protein